MLSSLAFGFVSGMWDSIVLFPDHCLSTYYSIFVIHLHDMDYLPFNLLDVKFFFAKLQNKMKFEIKCLQRYSIA